MSVSHQPPVSPRRTRRYWIRLLSALVIALSLTVVGTPAAIGFINAYQLLNAPCSEETITPGDLGYAWEDVTLAAQGGGHFRGYLIPGSNGAAVILPPTSNTGRSNRLPVAAMLAKHGYTVLTFESRRCSHTGPFSLGYKEVDDVGVALAFLQARPGIQQIGVMGFSSAGATSIMAAARYPDLRAVVAEGGYGDMADGVIGLRADRGNLLELVYKESFALGYRLITGVDIDRLSPLSVIGQIAPRPILLIYGSQECSLAGARQQQAAAGSNATLWIVEGARHGNYQEIAPEEYEAHVVAFFNDALLNEGA
jgi:pimeloyl-ACP methyl ester carboxylesterase